MRSRLIIVLIALSTACFAQSHAKSSAAPAPAKHYCQPDGAFCFSYPANWMVLGEAFGDGVVIAPPQTSDRKLWNVVTVVAMPTQFGEGQNPLSIDEVIDRAMAGMRAAGHIPATLERQRRTVAGVPGQMIRVRYHDEATARDWVEQLVFAEGPEQEIYSASLKTQPADLARLQPEFERILRTWRLQPTDTSAQGLGSPNSSARPAQSPKSQP